MEAWEQKEYALFLEKRASFTPCGFLIWDDARNRYRMDYPNVECELLCKTCGWNPTVMAERIRRRFGNERTSNHRKES